MPITILKRSLGDAGAAIDESHGAPSILREVLTALVKSQPPALTSGLVASPAAGELTRMVVDEAGTYDLSLQTVVGTTGTGGSTDVELRVNGTAPAGASTSTDNTEADGTAKSGSAEDVELKAGDVVSIHVTAVATGVADLSASAFLRSVRVE